MSILGVTVRRTPFPSWLVIRASREPLGLLRSIVRALGATAPDDTLAAVGSGIALTPRSVWPGELGERRVLKDGRFYRTVVPDSPLGHGERAWGSSGG
ncbi:MAG: hypothetical protein KatS3mg060_1099 [Dehalococcoidia bacterium]|nr:MAG: hypothetical protein KatS3mg060_1099 [Dehalococcoidia bacterium]